MLTELQKIALVYESTLAPHYAGTSNYTKSQAILVNLAFNDETEELRCERIADVNSWPYTKFAIGDTTSKALPTEDVLQALAIFIRRVTDQSRVNDAESQEFTKAVEEATAQIDLSRYDITFRIWSQGDLHNLVALFRRKVNPIHHAAKKALNR